MFSKILNRVIFIPSLGRITKEKNIQKMDKRNKRFLLSVTHTRDKPDMDIQQKGNWKGLKYKRLTRERSGKTGKCHFTNTFTGRFSRRARAGPTRFPPPRKIQSVFIFANEERPYLIHYTNKAFRTLLNPQYKINGCGLR